MYYPDTAYTLMIRTDFPYIKYINPVKQDVVNQFLKYISPYCEKIVIYGASLMHPLDDKTCNIDCVLFLKEEYQTNDIERYIEKFIYIGTFVFEIEYSHYKSFEIYKEFIKNGIIVFEA
jgi:type IV secretory pathway TrbL component